MSNTEHTGGVKTIDEAILGFLGERHKHECPNHLGDGCVNCRGTGMEQMPCLVCDKDGIAFKRRNEFKKQLEALMQDNAIEARLQENQSHLVGFLKASISEGSTTMYDAIKPVFENRCTELEQLRTTNQTLKGEDDA